MAGLIEGPSTELPMTGSGTQLTLAFPLNERCVITNFVVGGNAELIDRLQQQPRPGQFSAIWVWGNTGKSHLLQAACQIYAQRGQTVAYLPLADIDGR